MKKHALPLLVMGAAAFWTGVWGTQMVHGGDVLARMLKTKTAADVPWVFFTNTEVENGLTIPANTNVVFTLPDSLGPNVNLNREVLFGNKGTTTRYWGYCFPKPSIGKSYNPAEGLPGDTFLSEAERAARASAVQSYLKETFSPLNPPKDASKLNPLANSPVRHKKEIFSPRETCYIMTAKPLALGTDLDGDGLNSTLEKGMGLDPENPDSDGDGLSDGTEVLIGHTNPLQFDTDNDGIGDGIEDVNRNGRLNTGETDPRKADTDGDGLCDGLCALGITNQAVCPSSGTGSCISIAPQWYNQANANDGNPDDFAVVKGEWYTGEDKNRNGKVDGGETDPRKAATYGGVNDMHRFLQCALKNDGDLTNC